MSTTLEPTTQTGELCILDSTGDTRIMWNKDNADEVEAARATFKKLTKDNKYSAFVAASESGDKGRRLTEFDPSVERMILVPQYAGG